MYGFLARLSAKVGPAASYAASGACTSPNAGFPSAGSPSEGQFGKNWPDIGVEVSSEEEATFDLHSDGLSAHTEQIMFWATGPLKHQVTPGADASTYQYDFASAGDDVDACFRTLGGGFLCLWARLWATYVGGPGAVLDMGPTPRT